MKSRNPTISNWASPYIGKPWVLGAKGPEAYDCLGLVQTVYKEQFGLILDESLENLNVSDASQILSTLNTDLEIRTKWSRQIVPKNGDLVAMSRSNLYHHVGIFVESYGGYVLHAVDLRSVILDPVKNLTGVLWSKVHYYRHEDLF